MKLFAYVPKCEHGEPVATCRICVEKELRAENAELAALVKELAQLIAADELPEAARKWLEGVG